MESDGWEVPSILRPQLHHDHDSDDNCSLGSHNNDNNHASDETAPSSPFGHVTLALRRPAAAIVRANSLGSSSETTATHEQVGFHPGQQTRHRSPIPPQQKVNSSSTATATATSTTSSSSTRRAAATASRQQPQQPRLHNILMNHRRSWKFSSLIRLFVLLGGLGYAVLMMMLFSSSSRNNVWFPEQHTAVPNHKNPYSYEHAVHMETQILQDKRQALERAERRARQRTLQTQPPKQRQQQEETYLNRYEFILADDESRGAATPDPLYMGRKPPTLASLSELCGTHARDASRWHPPSFLAQDALHKKARVMITGILNPLGYRLALALEQQCGVQVMTGMDPMYPNTVRNRLTLLPKMQTLATRIPKLVQPIVQPYLGLNPRMHSSRHKQRHGKQRPMLLDSTREFNLLSFHPTHIVHLASYAPELHQDVTAAKEGRLNVNSPYVKNDRNDASSSPPLYAMRSSMVAMEHVLASVASENNVFNRPHVTYVSSSSSSSSNKNSKKSKDWHGRFKLVDELLADAYHSIKGVTAVGLRLPTHIYGPGGRPGMAMHDMAHEAVQHWHTGPANRTHNDNDDKEEFIFVDDVVDAIIAAMQYRPESSSPTVFDLGAGSVTSLGKVAELMERFKPLGSKTQKQQQTFMEEEQQRVEAIPKTKQYLQWSPTTTLKDGIIKLLAWHLDEKNPYGAPLVFRDKKHETPPHDLLPMSAYETGEAFLERVGATNLVENTNGSSLSQVVDDSLVLPCASECCTKRTRCAPSVLDSMVDLVQEVTKGCDIVMYTQSLGYNVVDLNLESQYMEDGSRIVCNFAFIPKDSKLVKTVTKKVPTEQLEKFGITVEKNHPDWEERRLEGLNGRLLYRGWILLWVDDGLQPLSNADEFLLKLAPGKFFAKDVTHAMYVHEKFPVTPNLEDVLFLADETYRPRLKQRSVYRNEDDGKKHKYVLDEEPERRAVLLTSPLKRMKLLNNKDNHNNALLDKIKVLDATKHMIFEIGGDPTASEPASLRKQREFYERASTFVNRMDMRSPFEDLYQYSLTNWIRTRWIVHDLRVEEGREVRCKWYHEHLLWGNDLDQLSFGHVMLMLELKRRLARKEPDDHGKPEEPPEMKELTDAHEWHAFLGGRSVAELEQQANDDGDSEEEDGAVASEPEDEEDAAKDKDSASIWYVRILSERYMLLARRAWVERNKRKQKKH